jgi:serine/threonine-protein kinase
MDADPTVSTHTDVASPGVATTTPLALGSTVGRFVIRERLGTGGMGEVYRADDTQLKRTVAIKRLVGPPDQIGAGRLLKEAQRASALNHPHIAGVYDVFSMENELLLVMEFVDGMTLRERMKRPMSVAEFCAIGVQCTEALTAAHASGILHGDLKPANIMLTREGQVKVCDFGLARRLPTSTGAAETTTTTQHGIAGTPAYLAPEAVLEHPLDERADIFSLGVVFYQMLALRNPFVADGLMATLDRILHESPPPLDRINPQVPGRLARTIQRMLDKDPRARTASAAEVGEVLSSIGAQHAQIERRRRLVRRVKIWAAVVVVAIATVVAASRPFNRPPPLPTSINLAVLPFTATGAAGDRTTLLDGLTESVSGQLARLTVRHMFQVVTEAERDTTGLLEARQLFGATLVLRGVLHYAGETIDVLTELVDTKSSQPIRSERFTIRTADLVAVQMGIVAAAARMMDLELDQAELQQVSAAGTAQAGAHEYYLQGRGYLSNYDRPESLDYAIDVFRKALDSDSRYALAYAGLGQAFWRKYEQTRQRPMVDFAHGYCASALDFGRTLAEPHVCMGMVLNGTGDFMKAAEEYRLAIQMEPTHDGAYVGLASAFERMNLHADAERAYQLAIDTRKHYWGGYNNLGAYYYRTGRYQDALAMFQQVVNLAPDSFRGHRNVGAALFQLDRNPAAIDAFKKSLAIRRDFTAASNLGTAYYYEGEYRLAADTFRQALELEQGNDQVWNNLAAVLDRTGRRQEAITAFRKTQELATERLAVNPKDADAHMLVADSSAALGETSRARQALASALALMPTEPHTLFAIGVFYEYRLGNSREALNWLAKAVEHGQTWREIDREPALLRLRKDPGFQQLRHPK